MYPVRLTIFALCILLISTSAIAGSENYSVDNPFPLEAVAGKTQDEVSKLLGEPSNCEAGKYGDKCIYKNGDVEIVFINDLADWITVTPDAVPFNKFSLMALGLEPQPADASGVDELQWHSIKGIRSISANKSGANVWYFYIKTVFK